VNRYLRTLVVAPMTTRSRLMPTRVRVRHNKQTGWIVVDQIRTVDRSRIGRKLDRLTHPEIRKLKAMIRETYVD
jgi:mRNA interferase MazF